VSTYRYVTSTVANARVAHLGYPLTACRKIFTGPHAVSDDMPADRRICRDCVLNATGLGWLTTDEAVALLGRKQPEPRRPQIVPLLVEGRSDRDVARQLGVSMRTVSRIVHAAMREAGARTRFQWGYKVGLAAR
jgi:hypothetical protein